MQIVKIVYNKISAQTIGKIVAALKQGKIIIYPTETFYGLGCDATNARAVKKIYKIKGRAENKALPFLVASLTMARKYLVFNEQTKKLSRQFWPVSVPSHSRLHRGKSGPLSLVLDFSEYGRKIFKRSINKNSFDAGVRISSNKIATLIVKKLGKPLISTSANPSGKPVASDAQTVVKYFQYKKFKPDIIIDAGKLPPSLGSTFVDARGDKIKILRKGNLIISKKFIKV
jgi:L-threonylcarbamoyladenylate synthase